MSQETPRIDEVARQFLEDVARLMEAMEINQAELARRLRVSPGQVSKILSGGANLTLSTLIKISRALDAPMLLRLAEPNGVSESSTTEAGTTQNSSEAAPAKDLDQVGSSEPSSRDLESAASKVIAKLDPEAVARIAKRYGHGRRRGPGRPRGSGLIPDDARLDRMADLLAAKDARSERQAAEMVAKNDPGHSEKSTTRRLRRKYASDREQFLAAARERLRRQRCPSGESGKGLRPGPGRAKQPPTEKGTPSSPPATSMGETPAFLADLQRDFRIDREIVELLRAPNMLEEIAQLGSAGFENPIADVTEVGSKFHRVIRVEDPIADVPYTRLDRATSAIDENLAATDLFSRVAPTKDLGYSRAASDDITGSKARMRDLDTWGEIDRRMKRLMKPWSD